MRKLYSEHRGMELAWVIWAGDFGGKAQGSGTY